MLSNISVYKMKMLVNGVSKDYLQLGSVATRKEQQGKGLARKIMEHIMTVYPNTPIFLFGDNEAEGYYNKMGFAPFSYKQPYTECKINNPGEMHRLEITDLKVDRYLKQRAQYSQMLDCINQYAINWFHLIYRYPNHIYEIPGLDVMLVMKQSGSVLSIFDIAASKPVSFNEILPYLHFDGVSRIEFGFNPDWLGLDYKMDIIEDDDGIPFIRGDFGLISDFTFPVMMAT